MVQTSKQAKLLLEIKVLLVQQHLLIHQKKIWLSISFMWLKTPLEVKKVTIQVGGHISGDVRQLLCKTHKSLEISLVVVKKKAILKILCQLIKKTLILMMLLLMKLQEMFQLKGQM
ncbi:MAG: hypothetical protein CMN04_08690 [Roseibacillus sp.]|nr:hypothetical protein [Roseibacillus sp.]